MDVVICTDNSAVSEALEAALVSAGHEVTALYIRASDCIARCRHLPPDLVVMDNTAAEAAEPGEVVPTLRGLGVPVLVVEADALPSVELWRTLQR